MSVNNWLNSEGEQEVHQQFTDEDFVQGVTEIEQEEEEEVEVIEPTLTAKKKLAVLRDALKIITEMVDNSGAILKSLRKIQTHIHEEVQRKQNKKQ
ncbi:20971_t:CDS:1, partial [Cetraspora pellucida]